HALSTLEGLGLLDSELIVLGVAHLDSRVVEHSLRLVDRLQDREKYIGHVLRAEEIDGLDARESAQLAFTIGYGRPADVLERLARLTKKNATNPWLRLAVLSSVARESGAPILLDRLADDAEFRSTDTGRRFLVELAVMTSR